MSRKDKLIKKLRALPKDYTYSELKTLLQLLGYCESNEGHSSGSKVAFRKSNSGIIMFHKPHPNNIMKVYQLKKILEILDREGLI